MLSAGIYNGWSLASKELTFLGDIPLMVKWQSLWRHSYAVKKSFSTGPQKAMIFIFNRYIVYWAAQEFYLSSINHAYALLMTINHNLHTLLGSFQLPLPVQTCVSQTGAIEEFLEKNQLHFPSPFDASCAY